MRTIALGVAALCALATVGTPDTLLGQRIPVPPSMFTPASSPTISELSICRVRVDVEGEGRFAGTCGVIGRDSVITAWHVMTQRSIVAEADRLPRRDIYVRLEGKWRRAAIIKKPRSEESVDLVLLSVDTGEMEPFRLSSEEAAVGDTLRWFFLERMSEFRGERVESAEIAEVAHAYFQRSWDVLPEQTPERFLHLSTMGRRGASGSPVLNSRDEVVGVYIALSRKYQKGIAHTLADLRAFLDR